MQIAKADRDAMNALYAQVNKSATPVDSVSPETSVEDHAEQEAVREGVVNTDKQAAKNEGWSEQAFKDHEEYLDTLEGILGEKDSVSWSANDRDIVLD
jgi:hypothetical protein